MTDLVKAGAVSGGDCTAVLKGLLGQSGEIVVPANTWFSTRPQVIGNNTRLIVDGTLQLAANSNDHLLRVSGNNVLIEGQGTLDGNRANQQCGPNGPFSAGIFAGAGVPFVSGNAVAFNLRVLGLTIANVFDWPISLSNVNGARLRDLQLINSGNSAQFSAGCVDCNGYGLRIIGIGDIGFAFYGGTNCCGLFSSTLLNNAGAGVALIMDSGSPLPCGTTHICGNKASGNAQGGIAAVQGAGGNGQWHNVAVITGNEVWANTGGSILIEWLANAIVGGGAMDGPVSVAPGCPNIVQLPSCVW